MRESGENYLENIYMLLLKQEKVRSIDVANLLEYSKASVSRAMHKLKNDGYIELSSSGYITLTEKGEKLAKKIYDRHVILTNFFHKVLKLPLDIAERDACRVEHVISEVTFQAFKNYEK